MKRNDTVGIQRKMCRIVLFAPRGEIGSATFEDLTAVEFEGYKLPAMSHWDEYLTGFYGNWRKHVVGAGGSGRVFIDLDRPYTDYLK